MSNCAVTGREMRFSLTMRLFAPNLEKYENYLNFFFDFFVLAHARKNINGATPTSQTNRNLSCET